MESRPNKKTEIWELIHVDENEKDVLMEIKKLVMKEVNISSESSKSLTDSVSSMKNNFDEDLGGI